MVFSSVFEKCKFVTTLTKADQQRDHRRAEDEPFGRDNVDQDRTRDRTEHEASRDQDHVKDDDILEAETVPETSDRVYRDDGGECRIEQPCSEARDGKKNERSETCNIQIELTRSDRPISFGRVFTICREVAEIVKKINAARCCAKCDKTRAALSRILRIRQ